MAKLDLSITERMEYETFVEIISNIPSCIFFKDTELKYMFSSHFWAQLASDSIVGKTDLDIRKDKENAANAMEADREILRTKKGCTYTIMTDIDGTISYLELIKEPIIDSNGNVLGIVGLINDITANKILEKKIVGMSEMLEVQCQDLEASNEDLKSTLEKVEKMYAAQKLFTASMNHELRSPLNGIIGNLQMLMDDNTLSAEQMENVQNAFISSKMMLEIVNDLLDYAKLEMSSFTIHIAPFSLTELLNNIQFVAKTLAHAKGLEFYLKTDASVQECYFGDQTRISQIIHNLVSNAVKYTPQGSITLSVSQKDEYVIFSCADTGQGIAEESMAALFDPFVRFNEAKNVKIQGTGLGLSVVKKIIELMDGEILVESKINEGSVFTVKIPLTPAPVSAIPKEAPSKPSTKKTIAYENLTALCVDDSKVSVKVMAALLGKIGMSADVAYSAKEGIQKSDEVKYDIIFMDHMMPEMDGLEAIDYIHAHSKMNAKTPIVMLTGNVDSSYEELYRQHGASGRLAKPVFKDQIVQMIHSII